MQKLKRLLLFVCLAPLMLQAQDDEIQTDRPSASFSPQVVPKKHFQVEVGLRKEYDKYNGQKHEEYLYPTALIKYGLSKKIELRMLIEDEGDYDYTPDKHETASGLKPLQFGFKYNLFEEKGGLPNTSFIASAALPKLASPDFKGDYVAPAFRLAMQHSISRKVSLNYNLGVEWESNDVHAQYIYTLSPQFELTNKLKGFVEVYGFISGQEGADHRFDAGLLYLIRPNWQVDISGGLGITKSAPNNFIEAGVSFRLPR
jgi:hypothetical protein